MTDLDLVAITIGCFVSGALSGYAFACFQMAAELRRKRLCLHPILPPPTGGGTGRRP